nr:zinc knuckle CX2CX4HX4C [Tanacetum cinerariifolium]
NANVSNIEADVKENDLNDEHVAMEVQSPLVDHTNAAKTVKSIRAISERFVNTAYGFFLVKRVVYPVVANYVRNTWGKFGLVKSMLNSSTGLFSFQFSSTDEDVGNMTVWVKLHGVPVTTFSEDGLSAIATKVKLAIM